MNYTLKRDARNGLQAKTIVPMHVDDHEVIITTDRDGRGQISSDALMVKRVNDTGTGFSGFSYDLLGTWRATVQRIPGRATEKTIRTAHESALQLFAQQHMQSAQQWLASGKRAAR